MRPALVLSALFLLLLGAHFCHINVLWAEEDLPLAAAQQMLHGSTIYSGIWFDKPPLVPLVYLLWGARIGFVLRLFGALYCFACCLTAREFARKIPGWGEGEGLWAAALLAFFLTFDTPSAVLPLAADLLLLLPHLSALYFASRRRPIAAGIAAGIGFLFNVKAALVLLACTPFLLLRDRITHDRMSRDRKGAVSSFRALVLGFATPTTITIALLFLTHSWSPYIDQVWIWPTVYAGSSHVAHPITNGFTRTANWAGFHAALILPATYALYRQTRRAPWVIWLALCFAGVILGARFFSRYYFLLLPPITLLAAHGFVLLKRTKFRWAILALLLIPAVRFGPRYPILALNRDPSWPDISMNTDSRAAATRISAAAHPGDTLYVWGYRPDIFVYTGLKAASRYLDSQAMTGVPADRHLGQSAPVTTATTAAARRELAQSRPTFIADGLSLYNAKLAMQNYSELRPWLEQYQEWTRTQGVIVYRQKGFR